ncbi:Fanconi anemia group G protein -like protein [Channa argus]|uniref:Fanconi anemia group G protein-like protein n=1 Tax=Channa argus TaxID=215402 RepID=A0A6G1Q0D5_CHAAH|nr:Fanconi anemia group G protein -like protein [Channa argus]KAK2902173.1 hypothetical protein Q8A73_011919 [Channa argus]
MSNKTCQPISLLGKWVQENNELVNKWKLQEIGGNTSIPGQNQTCLRGWSSEFNKLLRKIQGVPPLADHTQLELSVLYNACVCAISQSQFTEAELLLLQSTERALQMTGNNTLASDPNVFWREVLKSVGNTALNVCIVHLLCLQWAIWLATCQLNMINDSQMDLSSLFETLGDGLGNNRRSESSEIPLLLMDTRKLVELLQICTLIAQGAERLSEGQSSEALTGLQAALSLAAPRNLIAYIHLLSGSCLAQMGRPQMALQCYRNALETDSQCVCALYQSMLIYRLLGNTQAEIEALRLLHSTLILTSATESALSSVQLLSPSLLLPSQSLSSLLSVPSALSVLHELAMRCVLHGRVSEGVEHYLDLLATLHSEDQHGVKAEVPLLPRLPELYLEAGAALLMSRLPADCMVLCDEVISKTLELLPEKLILEHQEERGESETRDVNDSVAVLLWAGAAYLLQGQCYAHLKDWKQAVTHYTRCINLVVKVCFKKRVTGFQSQISSADMVVKNGTDLCILKKLKGLSLAGRGISFTQTDKLKEALRDLQLSVQTSPECVGAGLWCGEVLWRLGRRQEAAACWEKTWSFNKESSFEVLPLYLQEALSGPLLDTMELRQRVQGLGLT